MNQQISVQSETEQVLENDLLLCLLHMRVAKLFTISLMQYKERVPDQVMTGCLRTIKEMGDLERKILNATPRNGNWLRSEIRKDKVFDIANTTEMILRLGKEEHAERYEEMLSLIIDCMDTVFYTQKNRGSIYFPKYRALFNLIINELKADVIGHEQGQVIYKNGEIFLRTAAPETPTQVA